ncbi:MAG: hypothetical protein KA158_00180, partial [Leucobacter sp.]|nr:hypothetical protein [Leucobacter sp.]
FPAALTDTVVVCFPAFKGSVNLCEFGPRRVGEAAQPRPLRGKRDTFRVMLVVIVRGLAVPHELRERHVEIRRAGHHALSLGKKQSAQPVTGLSGVGLH